MSDKQKDKKKKKATIVAGIVGSAALIGGITAGIITTTETEENKKNKQKSTANPSAGQSKSQKNDLNNKVKTLWSDVLFDANKTNQELDSIILSDIHLTNRLQPNLVNPTIKYFSDSQAQTEVTNKTQKSGYLYVVITANDNDPNYQGSTNPMKISLKQYKLSDIQQLTGLNLITDSSKKFWEIENEINYKANEFKNKNKNKWFIFSNRILRFSN